MSRLFGKYIFRCVPGGHGIVYRVALFVLYLLLFVLVGYREKKKRLSKKKKKIAHLYHSDGCPKNCMFARSNRIMKWEKNLACMSSARYQVW